MKRGFSLIELMVYIVLFSLSVSLLFRFVTIIHKKYTEQSQHAQWLQSVHNAQHIMLRELEYMPTATSFWKRCTEKELVVRCGDEDKGFSVINNKLVCIRGQFSGHGWDKKHKNILADTIKSIHFSYFRNDTNVSGLSWEMVGEFEQKQYTIKQDISLRNQSG